MKRFAASATVAAPPEAVWRVLADVAGWPAWEPNTTAAEGLPVKDAALTFYFAYASRPVNVRVTAIDEPFLLEWTGGNEQFTGVRTHRVTPAGEGSRVEVSQVFSGPAVGQLQLPDLDAAFRQFLDALKKRFEA
jgi:uncharacterized protein YndB with AHSA1/START domain